MPHHDPARQDPPPSDPRAVARERLAARSRRLRRLRLRAAGGAVGVFLAAWLALFVPAQQASTQAAATGATTVVDTAAQDTSATDTYDSGLVEDTTPQDTTRTDDGGLAVEAAPATTSQS